VQFEDIKRVIRSCISKNRQYNSKKDKEQKDKQSTTHKTKVIREKCRLHTKLDIYVFLIETD